MGHQGLQYYVQTATKQTAVHLGKPMYCNYMYYSSVRHIRIQKKNRHHHKKYESSRFRRRRRRCGGCPGGFPFIRPGGSMHKPRYAASASNALAKGGRSSNVAWLSSAKVAICLRAVQKRSREGGSHSSPACMLVSASLGEAIF